MLAKNRVAQSCSRFASQLLATRGQKASTTKLPITLLEDVEHLGLQGQQVVVSHGYARNFLYPRQLAAPVPTKPRDRHQKVSQGNEPEGSAAASEDLQAILSMLTSQPVVMKCSIDADGVLSDQVSSEAISAAIRQQLNIDLAPQLISIPEPFTELGQHHAMLQITLPDGNRPLLQIHLTEP
ncbi:TPA: hypothetical protein ACH3X3_005545 [Trebouxia sp. C0006]